MKTYRVLPGNTFGSLDQFEAGSVLPANYLTDEEAKPFLGHKLEIVPDGASGDQQPSLLGQPGEDGRPRGLEQQPLPVPGTPFPGAELVQGDSEQLGGSTAFDVTSTLGPINTTPIKKAKQP